MIKRTVNEFIYSFQLNSSNLNKNKEIDSVNYGIYNELNKDKL